MAPQRNREEEVVPTKVFPKRHKEEDIGEEDRDWANIPTDVLLYIVERLIDSNTDNKFDVRRLRSVCTSWRSSIVPLNTPLHFPLELPSFPKSQTNPSHHALAASLFESVFYVLPPPQGTQDCGWLIKVRECLQSSKWHLENALSVVPSPIEHPMLFRGSVNMFDNPVKEVTRSYVLKAEADDKVVYATKVLVIWNSGYMRDDFTVLALFEEQRLGLWRPGQAEWSSVTANEVSDIIVFKGKFYASNIFGKLWMIDPVSYVVSDIIKVEPNLDFDLLYNIPFTNLIESDGYLYMLVKDIYTGTPLPETESPGHVRVYLLHSNNENNNNDNETSWESVNNIQDRVFFVGDDVTFSISAEELGWSKGNFIFFAFGNQGFFHSRLSEDEYYDKYSPLRQYFRECFAVFNMEDPTIVHALVGCALPDKFSKIFWPPPYWIRASHRDESPICSCAGCLFIKPDPNTSRCICSGGFLETE